VPPAPEACAPAPNRLCPVDDAAKDPSFDAYRQQLRAAVQQRDEAKLLPLIDPAIRTSFGDGGGIDDFKSSLSRTEGSSWTVLEKVLSLGGSFRGEGEQASFWAPYVYSNWPESIDPFQYVAAIRKGVFLRTTPAAAAHTVGTADWAILELLPADTPPSTRNWLHVKTADGQEGWVHTSDVHSPVGYRAGFNKMNGQWKMTAFVAGD